MMYGIVKVDVKILLALVAVLSTSIACTADPESRQGRTSTAPSEPQGQVLTISDIEVLPGDVVEVSFQPPPEHDVWGVSGSLWRESAGEWQRIAWTSGWAGKRRMFTYWPKSDLNTFPAVGFGGSASWEWKVPPALKPGRYELRKEWLPEAPASPDRPRIVERAPFTVLEGV